MGFGFPERSCQSPTGPCVLYCGVVRRISWPRSCLLPSWRPSVIPPLPFPLTSLFARLILFVSVYKRCTQTAGVGRRRRSWEETDIFFPSSPVHRSHTFPLGCQRGGRGGHFRDSGIITQCFSEKAELANPSLQRASPPHPPLPSPPLNVATPSGFRPCA